MHVTRTFTVIHSYQILFAQATVI